MAPDQWTITKKKNVSTPMAEGRPRKRARFSVAPSHDDQRQQTLTQARWIPSRPPSFQDELHLKALKVRSGRISNRATVKRNSTLTQMDFFRDVHVQENLDDAPLDEVDATANLPRPDGSDGHAGKMRSQEKPTETAGGSKPGTQKSRGDSQEDYGPAKKRRRHKGASSVPERNVRRMSSRLADREDKSNKQLAGLDNTFGEAIHVSSEKPGSGQDGVLEVQDSTDTDVDDVQLAPPQSQAPRLPAAPPPPPPPHTARRVILSSQSPEREESMRSPLREKSANLLLSRSRICTKPRRTTPPRSRKAASSPSSSKIVSLKLPKRSMHPRRSKVEDSQALWSLPMSSSSPAQENQVLLLSSSSSSSSPSPELSRAKPNYVGQGCLCLLPLAEAEKEESNGMEIPGTSQAEGDVVYPAETPTFEADVAVERVQSQGQQTEQLAGVLVRDFAPTTNHTTPCKGKDESTSKEAAPPKTPPPQAATQGKRDEQEEDSDLDFDSPIANDTQFNAEVARRTTTSSFPHDIVSEDSFFIPTPRLIRSTSRTRSSQANEQQQQQQESKRSCSEGLLPPAPQAGTTTTTTLVPLNDTLMGPPPPQPSSSPQAHSHTSRSTTTMTQRSAAAEVRPASMPHPSQISTQEATQFGLLSSLVPTAESPESAVKKERITIKEDSSSIGMLSLSQIPPAERDSQAVDLGLEEEEEEEEEEEIDLDECLNDHHHQHHDQSGRGVAIMKKADDAAPRTRIKQESQLEQSVVGQEGGGAEALSSSPLNHNHDKHYSPIPGFNNETQSNFTQGGHVTAAYIHRQRDLGMLPKWYTPKPYRVPGYTRR